MLLCTLTLIITTTTTTNLPSFSFNIILLFYFFHVAFIYWIISYIVGVYFYICQNENTNNNIEQFEWTSMNKFYGIFVQNFQFLIWKVKKKNTHGNSECNWNDLPKNKIRIIRSPMRWNECCRPSATSLKTSKICYKTRIVPIKFIQHPFIGDHSNR